MTQSNLLKNLKIILNIRKKYKNAAENTALRKKNNESRE